MVDGASRYLIVGASGYLGGRLLAQLGATAIPTYRQQPLAGGILFDSLNMRLADAINLDGLTHAVLFLGESSTATCALEPERTDQINIASIKAILEDLRGRNIKPVFMSSDAVFEGRTGNYTETSVPQPTMRYGAQKLAVEHFIQATFDDFLIFRSSKVYDTDPNGAGLLARWLDDIQQARTIKCATDHRFCPVNRDNLIEAMAGAITKDFSGMFHAAGPLAVTYWDLFHGFLDIMEIPVESVDLQPARINDFAVGGERRPIVNSMVSDRLYTLLDIERDAPLDVCRKFRQRLGAVSPGSYRGAAGAET